MLTLTENAASAVKTVVAQRQEGDGAGLRISSSAESPSAGFDLAVTAEPAPADAVVELEGARVFLDDAASTALGDQVLDAQVGADGAVRFALAAQG